MHYHIGRSWSGHPLEDGCPCPQEACGLISTNKINPECDQHPFARVKTIRQSHTDGNCPAKVRIEE